MTKNEKKRLAILRELVQNGKAAVLEVSDAEGTGQYVFPSRLVIEIPPDGQSHDNGELYGQSEEDSASDYGRGK